MCRVRVLWLVTAVIGVFSPLPILAEQIRDPTRPLSAVAAPEARVKIELQAIKIRGSRREAIVNGKIVREGDQIVDVTILKIDQKQIVYRRDGLDYYLPLRGNVFSP